MCGFSSEDPLVGSVNIRSIEALHKRVTSNHTALLFASLLLFQWILGPNGLYMVAHYLQGIRKRPGRSFRGMLGVCIARARPHEKMKEMVPDQST